MSADRLRAQAERIFWIGAGIGLVWGLAIGALLGLAVAW